MTLIKPHGGELSILFASKEDSQKIQHEALNLVNLTLNDRQLCDYEMLVNGAYSPLKGFLCESDYKSVISNNRLDDGVYKLTEHFVNQRFLPKLANTLDKIRVSLADNSIL